MKHTFSLWCQLALVIVPTAKNWDFRLKFWYGRGFADVVTTLENIKNSFKEIMSLTSKLHYLLNSQRTPQTHHPNQEKWSQRPNQNQRQALDARRLIKVTLLQNTDEKHPRSSWNLGGRIGVDILSKNRTHLDLYKQSNRKENRKISKSQKMKPYKQLFYRGQEDELWQLNYWLLTR